MVRLPHVLGSSVSALTITPRSLECCFQVVYLLILPFKGGGVPAIRERWKRCITVLQRCFNYPKTQGKGTMQTPQPGSRRRSWRNLPHPAHTAAALPCPHAGLSAGIEIKPASAFGKGSPGWAGMEPSHPEPMQYSPLVTHTCGSQ